MGSATILMLGRLYASSPEMLRWVIDQEELIEPVPDMSFGSYVILPVLEHQILWSSCLQISPSIKWATGVILFGCEIGLGKERKMLMSGSQIFCECPEEKSMCNSATVHCWTCDRWSRLWCHEDLPWTGYLSAWAHHLVSDRAVRTTLKMTDCLN